MFEQEIVVGKMANGEPLTVKVVRLFPPIQATTLVEVSDV